MASSIPRPRPSLTAAQGLSPVMKVPLGSRVVLSRRRNGAVRYVGKIANESGEWYGVALDEPKGDNDGMRGKERYFFCPPNHGIFVRRKEIYCVKESGSVAKSPPSPVTDESSSCSSNVSYTSTDQQGDAYGAAATSIVHPVPANADNPASPLMKTFKGFRKQLDFISLKTVGPGRSREASPVASPTSSSPSSPTAKSGLKPPSPFRRFSSFSQGLPTPPSPGSPTNKTVAASTDDRRRPSTIPLSPKPSPVRRVNSFRMSTPDNNDGIRPVEITSPPSSNRFNSFQYSPTNHYAIAATIVENEGSAPASPTELPTTINSPSYEVQPTTDSVKDDLISWAQTTHAVSTEDERSTDQAQTSEIPPISFSQSDSFMKPPIERSASVEIGPATDQDPVRQPHAVEGDSKLASQERTGAFHVLPIDISAIDRTSDISTAEHLTSTSPRDLSVHSTQCSDPIQDTDAKHEDSKTNSTDRTRSFRLSGLTSSFRVPSIDVSRCPPPSSSENSPSIRPNSLAGLLFDHLPVLDDASEDVQSSSTGSIVPNPLVDINEASAASAPETRAGSKLPQRSPRNRQEHTAVESLSPDKKLAEAGSGERPLFFRRMNVGRSPMERRSSYSSFSASSSSPPKSPTSSSTANAASRSSRVTELEKEISAMRSSHENIVAVLRATNKQHAGNVLELRAQVAALTEGNLWLERQLTAKGELVRELREMDKQQQRDSVSVNEVEKFLDIKDAQIQTLEREMAQLRQRLARLESDKDSQLYQQLQYFEARRDRDEKRINELRKDVLAMCNERIELQSEVRDLKEMTLRFF